MTFPLIEEQILAVIGHLNATRRLYIEDEQLVYRIKAALEEAVAALLLLREITKETAR